MNKDTIIRLAREAGFADGVVEIVGLEGFSQFAALVAAQEREECAKLCEEKFGVERIALECAAAIRSRT